MNGKNHKHRSYGRKNRARDGAEFKTIWCRWPARMVNAIETLAKRERRSINGQAEALIFESPTLKKELGCR